MEEKEIELKDLPIWNLKGVQKFKSVRRAIKRGNCSNIGTPYPTRPFNNRKPTKGREQNELKKHITDEYKRYLKVSSN